MLAADWIFIVVALVGTSFGCITDLKGRWVPDWTNYSLIIIGLGGHAILSVLNASIKPIIFSLAGAGFFYLIALAMFYAGAWGGGDAKLFIGLGTLLPVYPIILSNYSTVTSPPWPFLLSVWINISLLGAIFGLIATAWLAIRHRQKVAKQVIKDLKGNKILFYAISSILIVPAIMFVLNLPTSFAVLWILGVILVLTLFITKVVEKVCMYKIIPPSKLVVGDWVIEEIKIWGKTVYKPKRSGIEQEDIERLVQLEKAGKLKQVKIKEGLPYVPAILIGLIVSLFFGDLLYLLLGGLL